MFSEASVASNSIIDRLCSPYAMIAEILYFSLPSEWLLKHKGKPTCDFEAEFCSGITFRTGLDACFGTGLAMENRSPVPIFSENHRVLP